MNHINEQSPSRSWEEEEAEHGVHVYDSAAKKKHRNVRLPSQRFSCTLYRTLYRELVLLKQFLGKGYTGWFAIAFSALFVHALSFKC